MPLPVGVQLGVELTNFVLPLTKSALRLGTLAAREAIERSGSDELTELKLAEILGRLRLDAAIATHFRAVVGRSNWTAVSQFMKGVVLESGAGPTVSQALASDNPALLSMIVQLSFLSWSHEVQSLGQAIAQVVDEGLLERQGSTVGGFNYVALLGTIKACQEQTAAFSWEPHYRAVESKLRVPGSTSTTEQRLSSLCRGEDRTRPEVARKAIPFVVLSALLRFLEPIQRLPDEYLLELSCDQGISSVVIWCYHVLGLNVTVKTMDGTLLRFGDEPCSITINFCPLHKVSAVLSQRVSPNEPLFTLQRATFDPILETDERAAARGFLKTVLESWGYGADGMGRVGGWLAARCQKNCRKDRPACYEVEPATRGISDADEGTQGTRLRRLTHKLADEIWPTVSFLLDTHLNPVEGSPCYDPSDDLVESLGLRPTWQYAMMLVYAFAQVKDREGCGSMPLSVTGFHQQSTHNTTSSQTTRLNGRAELKGEIPDTIMSFGYLCELLLGRRYSTALSSEALLMSGRGWSIFFPTVDAIDPAEVFGSGLHIKFGVPARDGIRKARIVDGQLVPKLRSTGWNNSFALMPNSEISRHWAGLSTTKLLATHVGLDREHDAFTATQLFDRFDYALNHSSKVRQYLGLRLKQDMGRNWRILSKCPCDPESSTADAQRTIDRLLETSSGANTEFKELYLDTVLDETQVQVPERIFQRGHTWYFFATNHEAARWLAMKELEDSAQSRITRYIRGPGCCVTCAINAVDFPHAIILL